MSILDVTKANSTAGRAIFREPSAPPIVDARSGETYVFDELGRVPFVLSAAVICLRRRGDFSGEVLLRKDELARDKANSHGALAELMTDGVMRFSSGWQVLVGQSTVVNYLRSTKNKTVTMRYPGEWMLPGGAKDAADKSLRQTALRELREEFGIRLEEGLLFPFSARQTRRIKGKSNLVVNFVAFLEGVDLDLDAINAELVGREGEANSLLRSGAWDELPHEEKERKSPEIHKLAWLNIEDCVLAMQRSIAASLLPVNDWQKEQFALHGITSRSPMSVTVANIAQLELAGPEKLRAAALRAEEARSRGREDELLAGLVEGESYRFSSNVEKLGRRAKL